MLGLELSVPDYWGQTLRSLCGAPGAAQCPVWVGARGHALWPGPLGPRPPRLAASAPAGRAGSPPGALGGRGPRHGCPPPGPSPCGLRRPPSPCTSSSISPTQGAPTPPTSSAAAPAPAGRAPGRTRPVFRGPASPTACRLAPWPCVYGVLPLSSLFRWFFPGARRARKPVPCAVFTRSSAAPPLPAIFVSRSFVDLLPLGEVFDRHFYLIFVFTFLSRTSVYCIIIRSDSLGESASPLYSLKCTLRVHFTGPSVVGPPQEALAVASLGSGCGCQLPRRACPGRLGHTQRSEHPRTWRAAWSDLHVGLLLADGHAVRQRSRTTC